MLLEFILKETQERYDSFENIFFNSSHRDSHRYHQKFLDEFVLPNIQQGWIKPVKLEIFKRAIAAESPKKTQLSTGDDAVVLFVFNSYSFISTLQDGEFKYFLIPKYIIDNFQLEFYKDQLKKLQDIKQFSGEAK